ncbi:MAG TPA: MFS transporter [Roseiflexaceae bacterium]|nr:MFS transporter [Roseiflexaceae bacterium]
MQSTTSHAALRHEPETLALSHLALITFGRLGLTTAFRIIYPLLPFLSQRLQISLETVSMLVTVQVLASFASPLGGTLADTRGARTTMSIAFVLFSVGALCCALLDSFAGFLVGYALIGLAIALYQPAAQSYLSARTPYERRGMVLGIYELSWATSALLGVAPLMQLVQATNSVALVYWTLLAVALVSLAAIRWVLPALERRSAGVSQQIAWGVLRQPRVVALLGMLVLILCATDLVFVVQSEWLQRSFNADAAQLGQVFAFMGIAEFIGALSSTLLVDRVGKKRAVVTGYALTALAAALLPLSGESWLMVLALFVVYDLLFEFSIVSTFPLASELAPTARGTVLALAGTAVGAGRALGATFAGLLFNAFGMFANGWLAAALIAAGLLLCIRFVHEHQHET